MIKQNTVSSKYLAWGFDQSDRLADIVFAKLFCKSCWIQTSNCTT